MAKKPKLRSRKLSKFRGISSIQEYKTYERMKEIYTNGLLQHMEELRPLGFRIKSIVSSRKEGGLVIRLSEDDLREEDVQRDFKQGLIESSQKINLYGCSFDILYINGIVKINPNNLTSMAFLEAYKFALERELVK